MAALPWAKMYSSAAKDPILRALSREAHFIWFQLWCKSGESEERGSVSWNAEDTTIFAIDIGSSEEELEGAIKECSKLKIIKVTDSEGVRTVTFPKWGKYQRTKAEEEEISRVRSENGKKGSDVRWGKDSDSKNGKSIASDMANMANEWQDDGNAIADLDLEEDLELDKNSLKGVSSPKLSTADSERLGKLYHPDVVKDLEHDVLLACQTHPEKYKANTPKQLAALIESFARARKTPKLKPPPGKPGDGCERCRFAGQIPDEDGAMITCPECGGK